MWSDSLSSALAQASENLSILANFSGRVDVLIKLLSVARGQNLNFFFAQAKEGIVNFHLSLIRKLTEPWKGLYYFFEKVSRIAPEISVAPFWGGILTPTFLEKFTIDFFGTHIKSCVLSSSFSWYVSFSKTIIILAAINKKEKVARFAPYHYMNFSPEAINILPEVEY